MGCDTEWLEMLIILHICPFLMLYDGSNVSLGDLYLWVNLIFNWIIHLIVRILDSILNTYLRFFDS